ncbi:unnamed protein product [Caenorhabditis brenneri]
MDQSNSSSDDDSSSRKEIFKVPDIPDENPPSRETSAPMEVDGEDREQEQPIRRSLRPRAVRQRETTSTESDEEMDLDDDDDEEEDDAKADHHNDSTGANTSFVSAKALSQKDNSIKIGSNHQAVLSALRGDGREGLPENEHRIWDCEVKLDQQKLDEYLEEAAGRYRIPIDRALYILRKYEHDFQKAIVACANRKELKDVWSKEEKSLFSMAFYHFGKNFKKIHAAMPQRSLGSIHQYYYSSKKTQNYKACISATLNEDDFFDELFKDVNDMSRAASGLCENCNRNSPHLIQNPILKRFECKPCTLYFKLMRAPRPASLQQMMGRKSRPMLPDLLVSVMKGYVHDYRELYSPGDGKARERLGIRIQEDPEEEDDDCMIIEFDPLRKPSPAYIVFTTIDQDPVDPDTCRMTRVFHNPVSKNLIENARRKKWPSVIVAWREKQTKSMEDVALLNEACRQSQIQKTELLNNFDHVKFRHTMQSMRQLAQRFREKQLSPEKTPDPVIPGTSSRSGKLRQVDSWTVEEKRDAVRCFHWYHTDFEAISDVMITKSPEQVRIFYMQNKEIIDQSVGELKENLREVYRKIYP